MNLRILVIDDEAMSASDSTKRGPTYKSLEGHAGERVTLARSPSDAQDKLQHETYDVVLLDVWLKLPPYSDDDRGTVFQNLFLAASKVSMVALVSSNWDNTVVPRISRLLIEHPEVPVPPMLSFDELKRNHHAAVAMQLQAELRRRRGTLFLDVGEGDPLRIVHISDLHFGSTHEAKTLAGDEKLDALANVLTRATNGVPHFLAITGDVSNTGHPDEYDKARAWLEKLCAELKFPFPSRRILLVPGNHDFCLPISHAMKLKASLNAKKNLVFRSAKPTETTRKLAAYATHGFHDFATRVTGRPESPTLRFDRSWLEMAFRDYGVIFSGLNTCGRTKEDAWPDRWLDHGDAMKIIKPIRELNDPSLFHVMLSHHPPLAGTSRNEPITNVDEFDTYFMQVDEVRPNVILHGHEHARRGSLPWGDKVLVACAPTPSVREVGRAPDTLRGVNVLTLNRKAGRVESANAQSLVFEVGRYRAVEMLPESEVWHPAAKPLPRLPKRAPASTLATRGSRKRGR